MGFMQLTLEHAGTCSQHSTAPQHTSAPQVNTQPQHSTGAQHQTELLDAQLSAPSKDPAEELACIKRSWAQQAQDSSRTGASSKPASCLAHGDQQHAGADSQQQRSFAADAWREEATDSWEMLAEQPDSYRLPSFAPAAQRDSPDCSHVQVSREQQTAKSQPTLRTALTGGRRLAAVQLAAAVRQRVDADRQAAEKRVLAKIAVAKTRIEQAATAGSAADAGMSPASPVPAAANRQLPQQPAEAEEVCMQQGASHTDNGCAAADMQHEVSQAAYGSYCGYADAALPAAAWNSYSAEAAPMAAVDDSDDDVPPGFEQYSRSEALYRQPCYSRSIEPGLADVPPGFERRAPRVQAARSRPLQATSSGHLQQPGSAASGRAAHAADTLYGQLSLHSSASLGHHDSVSAAQYYSQPPPPHSAQPYSVQDTISTAAVATEFQQYQGPTVQHAYRQNSLSSAGTAVTPSAGYWQQQNAAQDVAVIGAASGWCSAVPLPGSQSGQQNPDSRQAAYAVGAAVPGRGACRGRRYLFVAGLVCRQCGAAGHEEAECSTTYCGRCNLVSLLLQDFVPHAQPAAVKLQESMLLRLAKQPLSACVHLQLC